MSTLEIKDLHVTVEGKEILKGVNLTMKTGKSMRSWVLTERVNQLYPSLSWAIRLTRLLRATFCLTVKACWTSRLTNVHA